MFESADRRAPDSRPQALLLWGCLLLGFSPTLVDLSRHLIAEPWARYTLIFPLLFVRAVGRERPGSQRDSRGLVWVGLGIGVELLALLAHEIRFGRVGLALGAIGLCRHLGYGSWRTLLLLAFAIPPPASIINHALPGFENMLLEIAAFPFRIAGLDITVSGTSAGLGEHTLNLKPSDNGLTLAALLVGLSWYHSLATLRSPRSAWLRAGSATLIAFPLQCAATAMALGLILFIDSESARFALSHALWLFTAMISILRTERAIQNQNEQTSIHTKA